MPLMAAFWPLLPLHACRVPAQLPGRSRNAQQDMHGARPYAAVRGSPNRTSSHHEREIRTFDSATEPLDGRAPSGSPCF
jgi:hypothetical protein